MSYPNIPHNMGPNMPSRVHPNLPPNILQRPRRPLRPPQPQIPQMPDLSHVSESLEGLADRLRGQFGGHGGGQRLGRAAPAAAIVQIHGALNELAQQINAIRNETNTRLSCLEASGYNLRAQRANLARPDNITHIAPLTHYLTNAVIPGFPNTDQECFDLSDEDVQQVLLCLGHGGRDAHARRVMLEKLIGIKNE